MPASLPSRTEKLAVTLHDRIATVAMRNAIDRDMWRALPPVLGALADDDRVRSRATASEAGSASSRPATCG